MKRSLMMAAVPVMFASQAAVAQEMPQPQTAPYENYVQVNGKAEREVTPDEIYIQIVVSEENLKNKQSVETVEQDMIRRLKNLGIDTDRDLKIKNMSSNYKEYVLRKNSPKTTATYELKVNGAAQLSGVYQTMETLGITSLNITKLSYSRMNEVQAELRAEAIRNAKEVASSLAGAIGQRADRAIYIVDYNSDIYPTARGEVMYARSAAADAVPYQTELEFRDIKLTYSITAKFALE